MQTQFPSSTTYASLGLRLRAHRIERRLGVPEVAARLKLPAATVEAMERDEYGRLGAGLAQGILCAYARLLDVPTEAVAAQFPHNLAEPATAAASAQSRIDGLLLHASNPRNQAVLVAAIALVLAWMALRSHADAAPGAAALGSTPDALSSQQAGIAPLPVATNENADASGDGLGAASDNLSAGTATRPGGERSGTGQGGIALSSRVKNAPAKH